MSAVLAQPQQRHSASGMVPCRCIGGESSKPNNRTNQVSDKIFVGMLIFRFMVFCVATTIEKRGWNVRRYRTEPATDSHEEHKGKLARIPGWKRSRKPSRTPSKSCWQNSVKKRLSKKCACSFCDSFRGSFRCGFRGSRRPCSCCTRHVPSWSSTAAQ